MYDFAYIVGTVLFFALMLAYASACARLGQRNPGDVAGDMAGAVADTERAQ